jgi:hypothetical protein
MLISESRKSNTTSGATKICQKLPMTQQTHMSYSVTVHAMVFCAKTICNSFTLIQKKYAGPNSTSKTKEAYSLEILVTTCKTIQCSKLRLQFFKPVSETAISFYSMRKKFISIQLLLYR